MHHTYIAYKYTKVKDKNSLKEELINISNILNSLGHETFILGRDVQNWDNTAHPVHSKMKKMFSEIKKSHCVFVYVTSSVLSLGLLFEIHVAKMLGKKVVVAIKEGKRAPYMKMLATNCVTFNDFSDLREQLKLCQ